MTKAPFRQAARRWSVRAALLVTAIVTALIAEGSGVATSFDHAIEPVRFAVLGHPASGQVVVVEMDAASAAAIKRWPWPRVNYAAVVDRLRRAGAASVVFDVDFSAPFAAADDAAFAAALGRADGLVALPTFGQQAYGDDDRRLDAMPIPLLRPHVALASVSIAPDGDGLVRDAPLGTMTYGLPHPSLSAYIAHRSGAADAPFPIDFALDPRSIPRLSFVSVRDGRFDPAAVRGRDVLIGATAVEMGDRYAVPRWSNLPGVVIQAMAAETLRHGIPSRTGPGLPLAAATLFALAILATRTGAALAIVAAAAAAALFAGALAAQAYGHVVPVAAALIVVLIASGGGVALLVAARFAQQRRFDEETGLPNQRALVDRAEGAAPMLVAFVANLDSLAAVLPAGAEHQLILRLAERLQFVTGGTVHRVADRLLATTLVPDAPIAALADRLRPVLLAPIEVAGRRVDAVVVIGVDATGATTATRLSTATHAAEQAARAGRFWRADGPDLAAVAQNVSLLGDLDRAVATGAVTVAYQPKLALVTGRVQSAEALVRWRTADGATVPPSLFIPMAEQAGRIEPLTLHVLRCVLADLKGWLAEGHDLRIAVNISAKLLGVPGFDDGVMRLVADAAVPPERLIFEITESAALDDLEAAIAMLERFAGFGIALSMDDYGTGQSTLSYLRRLPLSEIKIDRAFVQHIAVNDKDEMMVRSTIDLAHQLGLKVVAEGIEDAACLARLRALGCDLAQGYHIARPLPVEAFTAFLDRQRGQCQIDVASWAGPVRGADTLPPSLRQSN